MRAMVHHGLGVRAREERARPRLRGWIHAVAAPAVLAAGITLTCRAPTLPAAVSVAVFTATAAWLFAVSAVYHLGTWPPRASTVLRRTDHADILFLIAGTYTPVAVLALDGRTRIAILAVVWSGAVLSAIFNAAWAEAPQWVYVPLYLGVGWAAASPRRGGPGLRAAAPRGQGRPSGRPP